MNLEFRFRGAQQRFVVAKGIEDILGHGWAHSSHSVCLACKIHALQMLAILSAYIRENRGLPFISKNVKQENPRNHTFDKVFQFVDKLGRCNKRHDLSSFTHSKHTSIRFFFVADECQHKYFAFTIDVIILNERFLFGSHHTIFSFRSFTHGNSGCVCR